jgi:hypothetical protein
MITSLTLSSTQGPSRISLSEDELAEHRKNRTLIEDERRRRTLYFDGRFLTAADLTRDQDYFLSRQSDLGRAAGEGVIRGLRLSAEKNTIRITAGLGVTSSGELVVVENDLNLRLSDIQDDRRLDAVFGLSQSPKQSPHNRSGLFVLALRAVEYSANPTESYPTDITGTRSLHDGDIIEGTIVTLIPYPDQGATEQVHLRRSRVAREIFVDGSIKSRTVSALPLAMVALEAGRVQWVDVPLVRREVGASQKDILGFGFAPRVLRESHLLQYDQQLREVQTLRGTAGPRFAAASYFQALPPAGRMPNGIDTDFTQLFFPPEVDVDLTIIPSDELSAMLEEGMLLPPIDLTASGEELESIGVSILVPVPRAQVHRLRASLKTLTKPLKPAAPGLVAKRRPLESLQTMKISRLKLIAPAEPLPEDPWREALSALPELYYVRLRDMPYRVQVEDVQVPLTGNENAIDTDFRKLTERPDIGARILALQARTSAISNAGLTRLLGSPKFAESPLLLASAVNELEKLEKVDAVSVEKINERYSDPQIGEGMKKLEEAIPEIKDNPELAKKIIESNKAPEIDKMISRAGESELPKIAKKITDAAKNNKLNEVAEPLTKPSVSRAASINVLRVR